MKLFILGLRRSGTTIFWKAFRKDSGLVCYDEPFNPLLSVVGAPDTKETLAEYRALRSRSTERWSSTLAPIDLAGELQSGLSDRQEAWLRFLIEGVDDFAIDLTRCHFKVAELHRIVPDAVVVHLYRPAAAFATSHLAPRAEGWRAIKNPVRRATLFHRRSRYNYWGMEWIVGRSSSSLFAERLREAGVDPDPVYRLPAVGRLLTLWRLFYERVQTDGIRCFGDRFLSVRFADFCRDPGAALGKVYEVAGRTPPRVDHAEVHPARGPYRPSDPRWRLLGEQVGLPPESGLLL